MQGCGHGEGDEKAKQTPLVDLLRRFSIQASGTIVEPNGWELSTNIGALLHEAADQLEAQGAEIAALKAERQMLLDQMNRWQGMLQRQIEDVAAKLAGEMQKQLAERQKGNE